ncbi:nucleotide disphospho-sugar-binding domain-containing protein [Ulvibacterium sp.]|uniref:glycosyltransferase n=1 Tax=Ulvibacterium sp. TaxID=2665914 RepID=UPI0026358CBF|nr:nucleotide disphospho-sugar-binding domain-containing protein [Ulvibacterium sp.]
MSKILVACAAADGHVNPFVPVVDHLVKREHEVVWLCGRAYQNKIEAVGAKFIGLPEDFDPKGMDIYEFKPELKKLKGIAQIKFYIKTWCYDMAIPTIGIIDALRKDFEPDLYISDPMVYGPYFFTEKYNTPSINLHVIPLTLSSRDHGPFGTGIGPADSFLERLRILFLNFLAEKIVFRDLKSYCNKLRNGMGLKPYDHIFNSFLQSASTVFATTIPGLDYQRSDMPKNIKYLGPILPDRKTDFTEPEWWAELQDERKVILVNQGTIANDITELILPTIEAFKRENVLLIALPVKTEIKDLPSHVKTAEFIPFGNLLPYVDVMVTNGGFGATHMALAHGIPLVSSGGSEDKMEVSARVAHSGCGINLNKLRPKPKEIKSAVKTVLENTRFKKSAQGLKQEIETYAPLHLIAEEIRILTKS